MNGSTGASATAENAQLSPKQARALALEVVKEIEDDLIRAGVLYAQAWM